MFQQGLVQRPQLACFIPISSDFACEDFGGRRAAALGKFGTSRRRQSAFTMLRKKKNGTSYPWKNPSVNMQNVVGVWFDLERGF